MKMTLNYFLDEKAFPPEYAHEDDAGMDLRAPDKYGYWDLRANSSVLIDTGVHVVIPKGYVGMLKSKSGLNVKNDITTEGVIDAGYTGSIKVKVRNHSDYDYKILGGDKITQLVVMPVMNCKLKEIDKNRVEDTDRGSNGFGSTGR